MTAKTDPAGIVAFQKVCDDIGFPVPTEEEAKAFYAFADALIKHDEAKAAPEREPATDAVLEMAIRAFPEDARRTYLVDEIHFLLRALKGKGASQGEDAKR